MVVMMTVAVILAVIVRVIVAMIVLCMWVWMHVSARFDQRRLIDGGMRMFVVVCMFVMVLFVTHDF